jgi:hypothetical protein
MTHGPGASQAADAPDSPVAKILPFVSVATKAMTRPQIWTSKGRSRVCPCCLGGSAAGRLPLVHPRAGPARAIYVACIGWILLNGVVVVGVLVHGWKAAHNGGVTLPFPMLLSEDKRMPLG